VAYRGIAPPLDHSKGYLLVVLSSSLALSRVFGRVEFEQLLGSRMEAGMKYIRL
jgi:hypothetical protein